MKLSVAAAGLMASLIASQLSAQEAYNRVFLCDGDGVKMEIYIPESASRDFALKDGRPVLAWYALDLSDPDLKKGKSLEAVPCDTPRTNGRWSSTNSAVVFR